ncbi:MAG TPA: 30S ribosomal protein S4e [Candidatus Nanoarchaeia archaeon]|nr:30S ribosomal protein S4e [Candidatus Nanoarchaeia archaeon]
MGKSHLKRLNAPKQWPIKRKGITYILRPYPGAHTLHTSMPLGAVLRDMVGCAHTLREVKLILESKHVLINGVRRREVKYPVGLLDVLVIEETESFYRLILTHKGNLCLMPIDKSEKDITLSKIANKTKLHKQTQLNLEDGSNLIVDKDEFKTSDVLLLKLPSREIQKKVSLEKGSLIYLTGGKHIGSVGIVEDIAGSKIWYKLDEAVFETIKEYAFVVGTDKPLITIQK